MFHWIFNNCLIQGKCVISRIPRVCGSAAIHRNLRNDWPHRKSRRLNYYHYLWNPSRCKRASPYPVISRGYIECKFVLIQGAKEKEGGRCNNRNNDNNEPRNGSERLIVLSSRISCADCATNLNPHNLDVSLRENVAREKEKEIDYP